MPGMGWGCFDRESWITSRSHPAPSSHLSLLPGVLSSECQETGIREKTDSESKHCPEQGEPRDIRPRITHTDPACGNGTSGAKPASVKHTWGSTSESHPCGSIPENPGPRPCFQQGSSFFLSCGCTWLGKALGSSARPRGSSGSRRGCVPGPSRAAIPLILPRPCPGLGTPRLQLQPTCPGFCTGGKSWWCKAPTSAHWQKRSLPGHPGTDMPRPGKGGLLEPVEVPSSCSSPPKVPLVGLLGLD